MTKTTLSATSLQKIKIVVCGDVMLDRYVHGEVKRISPEAPVPVLNITKETQTLGGAGNVLANLKGLGVAAKLVGVIGDDAAGHEVKSLCGEGQSFLISQTRPTIEKTRFLGNGQQMMRVDQEKVLDLEGTEENEFIENLKVQLKDASVLILSDYGKGALTPKVLKEAIAVAKAQNVKILVDPKGHDYSRYAGADFVTPNRNELGDATGNMPTANDAEIETASRKLLETSGIKGIVATRSADGMSVLSEKSGVMTHLKTEAREVFDVSGAGDTVIATFAVGLASGMDAVEAARLANQAAGVVVGKMGTTAITSSELLGEQTDKAWLPCEQAKVLVDGWKAQGLKVGFTNGCFDIIHAGHVTYLKEAAQYCDRLVVALNHDNSVRILKGPTRPVNDEDSRAVVLSALASVDAVVLFGAETQGEDNTPVKLLNYLQPDVFFKGGDYTEDQLPEAKIVRSYGGDVKLMGLSEGKSTTNIIKKISAA